MPEYNPLQTTAPTQSTLIGQPHAGIIPPPPPGLIPPPSAAAAYLPPFHFSQPDFLTKNPFLPYDLANFRNVANGRTMHHIQQLNASQTTTSMNIDHMNNSSSRLSPASSRPSSSSPPSTHSISMKINTSIDVQSTNDSDDSDDEQIDVVKSAFVPILQRSPNSTQSIIGIADSTVHEPIQTIERTKCDLKAPSSRKPGHETAPIGPRSPETKLKSPNNSHITVWRPYSFNRMS